jgi:hypothetical protein
MLEPTDDVPFNDNRSYSDLAVSGAACLVIGGIGISFLNLILFCNVCVLFGLSFDFPFSVGKTLRNTFKMQVCNVMNRIHSFFGGKYETKFSSTAVKTRKGVFSLKALT